MEITTLFSGEEAEKIVEDIPVKATPVVGISRGSYVGVGLRFPNGRFRFHGGEAGGGGTHKLVTAYRAMKLAERIPEFGERTLQSCWFAGEQRWQFPEHSRPIEALIGADARREILNTPLPSLDEAITALEGRVDASELARELKEGRLAATETINKAIDSYCDRHLIFRGITGKYALAYSVLTAAKASEPHISQQARDLQTAFRLSIGAPGMANYIVSPREFNPPDVYATIHSYTQAAKYFIANSLPALREGYKALVERFVAYGGKMPEHHREPSLFSRLWGMVRVPIAETASADQFRPANIFKPAVHQPIKGAGEMFKKIGDLSTAGEPERFVGYTDSFRRLGDYFHYMKFKSSWIADEELKEPAQHDLQEKVRNLSQGAGTLLTELNRGLRTHMAEIYALEG